MSYSTAAGVRITPEACLCCQCRRDNRPSPSSHCALIWQISPSWIGFYIYQTMAALTKSGENKGLVVLHITCFTGVGVDMIGTCNGPLARYVILWVAHAPGMPETFSSPPAVSDTDMHSGTCVTHAGIANYQFPLTLLTGETFPACPVHALPAILRIW